MANIASKFCTLYYVIQELKSYLVRRVMDLQSWIPSEESLALLTYDRLKQTVNLLGACRRCVIQAKALCWPDWANPLLVPVEGLTEEALKYGDYSQLQLDDSHKLQYLQIISFRGPIHVSPLINAVLKDVMLIAK
jgi:hypothetical protein